MFTLLVRLLLLAVAIPIFLLFDLIEVLCVLTVIVFSDLVERIRVIYR